MPSAHGPPKRAASPPPPPPPPADARRPSHTVTFQGIELEFPSAGPKNGAKDGGAPRPGGDDDDELGPSIPGSYASAPAVLSWRGLTVKTKVGDKKILDGVTGIIIGQFTAVMGPSGCGKSSLLNTLARRLDNAVEMDGELRLNGREYTKRTLKQCSGYVMQDDLLNGRMTVEETLRYTAELKLPPTATAEMRAKRVEQVCKQMGLMHIRNVVVGDALLKGVSGGERKRLCVAMELLTRPALLFLDEPTSGLDSVTALSLVRSLKRLSDGGHCTIVCTIHQPQAKIFYQFDRLLLLRAGIILYQGSSQYSLEAFEEVGYPCPDQENPADHLLDTITPNSSMNLSNKSISAEAAAKLIAEFGKPDVDLEYGQDQQLNLTREFLPWARQVEILFRRSLHEISRKRDLLLTQLAQTAVMATLIGTAFLQIGNTQTSVVRRGPLLFFCAVNQGVFGAMQVINSFPSERALSLRERSSGTYEASAYFLAKTGADTLAQLLVPTIFSLIVYFSSGLQVAAAKFFTFWAFMILSNLTATGMAMAISAFARTADMSVVILPILLEISRLFGGYFLSPADLPIYFSWLDALSYVKYVYVGVALNEYTDLALVCTPEQLNRAGVCPVTSGQPAIDTLGLGYISIGGCAGTLIAMCIFYRLLAYVGIRYIKG